MRFIETPIFVREVDQLPTAEQQRTFQNALLENPDLGDKITHCGGARKMRWGSERRGKRGGVRIIYVVIADTIWLFLIFPKNEASDLSSDVKSTCQKSLRSCVMLRKKLMNPKIETMLLESADQAIAKGELQGRVTTRESVVSSVRHKLNLPRSEFAKVLGVSSRTVESWEQGRRVPGGAVSVLLRIAERNPKAVLDALK
jgi:DNA-binding transcriptional regulator YiaG/mRNA-degrading endonuclease RelE of RelBE toxin-antitoxin system